MPSIWPLGAPLQAPAGPPVLHAHCLLPGAGSALAWLPVRSWKGLGASRATLGGLAEWAPGPAEHWGPPGAWLGGVAPGRRGPGPRAGSSAMVSRLHSEETDLCMEKGRGSVGERERPVLGVARGCMPTGCPHSGPSTCIQLPPRPPPSSPPSGSTAAGEGTGFYAHRQGPPKARAAGHTGAGPCYLALSCSQFLTREAAWGQKEQGGQQVWGWPWTQEGRLGKCRREAQLLTHPPQVGSTPCDQGPQTGLS